MKLSVKEIAEKLRVSERAVRKRLSGVTPIEKKAPNHPAIYDIADLPEDYRYRVLNCSGIVRCGLHTPDRAGLTSPGTAPFNQLPDAARRVALARADLIRAIEAEKTAAKKAGSPVTEKLTRFVSLYNEGKVLPATFEILGCVTLSTIYRWEKAAKAAGLSGIAPKYGLHRRGVSKITEDEKAILREEYLNPNKPSVAESITNMRFRLLHAGIKSTTSDRTLRRYLDRFIKKNYDTVVFMREGAKALNDKVSPYVIRDRLSLRVGECLVADGHIFNFNIINPITGRAQRMVLVTYLDWRSGYPAGFAIAPTEDIAVIHGALRNACINLGALPRAVYLDNGRAFKAKLFTNPASVDLRTAGISGLYSQIGTKVIFARPYHGQSKIVERWHKELHKFEKMFPSYIGAGPLDKPARMQRNEKWHQKHTPDVVPNIQQVAVHLRGWLREMYGMTPSKGLAAGETPLEVFESGKGPGLDNRELNTLLLPAEERLIGRNGVQMFGGLQYNSDMLYGLKERVIVRYDFADLSRVWVYEKTGEFICEAKAVGSKAPLAVLDKESWGYHDLKAELVKNARLKKATRKAAELELDMRNQRSIPSVMEIIDGGIVSGESLPAVTTPPRPAAPGALPQIMFEPPEPDTDTPAGGNGKTYESMDNLLLPKPSVPYFADDDEKYVYLLQHGIEDAFQSFVREYEASMLFDVNYGDENGRKILDRYKEKGKEVRRLRQKKGQRTTAGRVNVGTSQAIITTIGG